MGFAATPCLRGHLRGAGGRDVGKCTLALINIPSPDRRVDGAQLRALRQNILAESGAEGRQRLRLARMHDTAHHARHIRRQPHNHCHPQMDFVDLNIGCPIDVVVNRGGGSFLMRKRGSRPPSHQSRFPLSSGALPEPHVCVHVCVCVCVCVCSQQTHRPVQTRVEHPRALPAPHGTRRPNRYVANLPPSPLTISACHRHPPPITIEICALANDGRPRPQVKMRTGWSKDLGKRNAKQLVRAQHTHTRSLADTLGDTRSRHSSPVP